MATTQQNNENVSVKLYSVATHSTGVYDAISEAVR